MHFHRFTLLPPEIRLTIWEATILARVVKIQGVFRNDNTPVTLPRFSCSGTYYPSLLAVSQESRRIGLEHYVVITTPEASNQNDQPSDQAIYIHPILDTLFLDFHLNHLPRALRISDSLMLIRKIAVFANSDLGPAYRFFISKQNRMSQFAQFDVQPKDICSIYFDPLGRLNYRNEGSVAQCLAYFRQPKERTSGAALSTKKAAIFPRLRTLYLVAKDECMGETIAPSAIRLLDDPGNNHIRALWRNSARDCHEDFPEMEQVHIIEYEYQKSSHTRRNRAPIAMPRGEKIPDVGEVITKCLQENSEFTKR